MYYVPQLTLIPNSEKIIPEIIKTFIDHYGKSRALFLLSKYAEFVFSNHRSYSGENDQVAEYIYLETYNGPLLSNILLHIVQDEDIDLSEHIDWLKALYSANGLELEVLSTFPLKDIDAIKTPDSNEQIETWLEKNVPSEVFKKMVDAKRELLTAHTDDALADCREALEKFTVSSNFTPALNELVANNLIAQGSNAQKKDFRMLQTIYHYTSTLGSHTSSRRPKPTHEQAHFGYMLTEVAIRFIVKILRDAQASGISLSHWEDVPT